MQAKIKSTYKRRRPKETLLYKVIQENWLDFLRLTDAELLISTTNEDNLDWQVLKGSFHVPPDLLVRTINSIEEVREVIVKVWDHILKNGFNLEVKNEKLNLISDFDMIRLFGFATVISKVKNSGSLPPASNISASCSGAISLKSVK